MALHQHFRFSLTSDADKQFYQFTSESSREKTKTMIIGVIEFLLNEKALCATSSSDKTESAAKQDEFFCFLLKQ